MENNNDGSIGFNKRRAEGLDKNDKPKKTLHLKTRELNPTNTICYVQVYNFGVLAKWVFFHGCDVCIMLGMFDI